MCDFSVCTEETVVQLFPLFDRQHPSLLCLPYASTINRAQLAHVGPSWHICQRHAAGPRQRWGEQQQQEQQEQDHHHRQHQHQLQRGNKVKRAKQHKHLFLAYKCFNFIHLDSCNKISINYLLHVLLEADEPNHPFPLLEDLEHSDLGLVEDQEVVLLVLHGERGGEPFPLSSLDVQDLRRAHSWVGQLQLSALAFGSCLSIATIIILIIMIIIITIA